MTANECLKALALAMSEFQIYLAAVAFDRTEGMQLARSPVIGQCAEVSPIDIEAFTGTRLYTHISTPRGGTLAHGAKVILEDRNAAVMAQRLQPLRDDRRGGGRVLVQQLGDGRLEGVELAGAVALCRSGRRRVQIPGNGAAANAQRACDFA